MRTAERDFLLFILAAAAGAADGWSYMGLGHAFVANMTGNTVLIGLGVFTQRDLIAPLVSLGCYAVGTAVAAYGTRTVGARALWSRAVSWTLLAEGVLMAGAEVGWALHTSSPSVRVPVRALLGCVAFAVGLQSGTMLQLDIPGIVTTYISGTWTTLMSGLATFASRERDRPAKEKLQFEERLLMQAGIVGVYLAAAVLAGWLSQRAPVAMGVVPSTLVLFVATYGLVLG